MNPEQFRVLFVCTGNICRSPIAEQLVAARVDSDAVQFSSAGTAAVDGSEMPVEAQEVSRHLGGQPNAHRARRLTTTMVEQSDLVIALAREHRAEVVRAFPRSSRYTFTLRELARLVESLPPSAVTARAEQKPPLAEQLRALIPLVASRRGFADLPLSAADDDIADPYGQSQTVYDQVGSQISAAVERIIAALGPTV